MLFHGTDDARGFRQWQREPLSEEGKSRLLYHGSIVRQKEVEDEITHEKKLIHFVSGFKAIPVFGMEDTDGEDLPIYKPLNPPPLLDVAEKWGLRVQYENMGKNTWGSTDAKGERRRHHSRNRGMGYSSGWGLSYPLYRFLTSPSAARCGFVMGNNVIILNDINVTEDALFYQNGSRRFDTVIIGSSEYMTLQKYIGYKHFATGGSLIMMASDSFEVQVNYSTSNSFETFVRRHGFAFDGKTAWHVNGSWGPWDRNNTNWMGSTLCCFHRFTTMEPR